MPITRLTRLLHKGSSQSFCVTSRSNEILDRIEPINIEARANAEVR